MFFTNKQEFKQILKDTISDLLNGKIPQISRKTNRKEYLTTVELKELTGCSYRIQHYLWSNKKISYSQEGRKIFYLTKDVEKFMKDIRIKAKRM